MKYVAVAINNEIWVGLSKPVDTQEQAEMFRNCVMVGETFVIVTEDEWNERIRKI